MSKREPAVVTATRLTQKGGVITAIITLIGIIVVGYWQFGSKPNQPNTPITTSYSGRTIDANSQQPVAGAKVTLDLKGVPPIVYTDSEGVYHFDTTINTEINGTVRVDAPDYQVYTRNISISPSNPKIEDIRLKPLPKTATPQPTSSPTNTPEIANTATDTPQPTETPLVVKTIADGCLYAGTWRIGSTDQATLNSFSKKSDNCYDTGALGIFPNRSGTLHIVDGKKRDPLASGIYTPINNDAVIEFTVHVNSMFISNSNLPVYINFAVAPANDPLTTTGTARFKLQVQDNTTNPLIYFVLADTGENNGAKLTSQHYERNLYHIRLELTGSIMSIFINNGKINEILKIPAGPKVFYIGYSLPTYAGVNAEVTDIKIDGALK